MATRSVRRTWDEFWAERLVLRFHADNPQRWAARRERAQWLFGLLQLTHGSRIVDLGCGDGILDICLGELGAQVKAVDRATPLVAAARREPGGDAVDFRVADLRILELPASSSDVVLVMDVVGLMSVRDDADLVRRAFTWLTPPGQIVVEWPGEPSEAGGHSTREFDDGTLQVSWAYDPDTRLMHIIPEFQASHGERVELHDPYDPAKPDHCGVLRYLYPEAELADLLTDAGFVVRPVHDSHRPGSRLLAGTRAG